MIINDYSSISKQYAASDNSGTAFLAFKHIDEFIKKYGSTKLVEGISFHQVDHVNEAIALIME